MKSIFSLFDLLILLGIVQGIVTSILLIRSKKNQQSNQLLALALISFCLLCTKPLLHTLGLWNIAYLRYFPNAVELSLSPLFYFYIHALIFPKFRFQSYNWLHFIPFIFAQAYAFIVYFATLTTQNLVEKDQIASGLYFNEIKVLEEYLVVFALILYLFFGYREVVEYRKWLHQNTSDSTYPDFNWLLMLIRIFIGVGAIKMINHSLDIFLHLNSSSVLHWNFLILIIAFLIYYLGLKGYLLPDYNFDRASTTSETTNPSSNKSPSNPEALLLLEKAMKQDKLFLQPKLNLKEFAEQLNLQQKEVSQLINQHFKLSFREFVNHYRVEEVKVKLKSNDLQHMSILGIALECGFNSEASFYRIFKNHTGVSPKEFTLQ